MLLITGAGGKTGRALIRSLSKVESVRAFVRREEQASAVKSVGADQALVGDLRDLLAIRSAMEGVRAVYHICPNMSPDEEIIGELAIAEAKRVEVEHFICHSVLHPQTAKMNHHWNKLHVEERLFESGLPFTILQPAPYMQNLLAGWQDMVERGVLRVPYSVQAKFSFLDLEDLAEAASIMLSGAGHFNATYELAGTTPISHAEVAEIIGRILGRHVRAESEDISIWRSRAAGLSEHAAETLPAMFAYYDRWGLPGNPNVLRWILQREPTSFASFVQRHV